MQDPLWIRFNFGYFGSTGVSMIKIATRGLTLITLISGPSRDKYIRRDIEGSDLDTRRRIACELLKGIAKYYEDRVKEMISMKIQNLLASYGTSPAGNWKEKDCAIYLVVSLAIKTAGSSMVTTDLVELESFFATVIVPELKAQDVNEFPMLKAGALKFFTTFRNHIPKPFVLTMMPDVIRFLKSESNVVHSYAANCIEKLLLVKDVGRARYTPLDINPLVPLLLPNLFNALKFPESQENLYIMKCIMRVLGVVDVGGEVVGACITNLTAFISVILYIFACLQYPIVFLMLMMDLYQHYSAFTGVSVMLSFTLIPCRICFLSSRFI